MPVITSPDQLTRLGQRSADYAARTVRRLSGNLAAGDLRVEYPPALVSPVQSTVALQQYFDLRQHYLEESYYPAVAKKLGVGWPNGR